MTMCTNHMKMGVRAMLNIGMAMLALVSEEFEVDIVVMPDKSSGWTAAKCMHPVFGSKTSPAIASPMTDNVNRHKTVKPTGNRPKDRDALIVVGGLMDDECGVGRVKWRYLQKPGSG